MVVKKAEESIRNTAKWRQENGVASLIEESFPEGWLETMPIYIDAVTPDGVLIVTIEAGLIDFLGMLNKFGRKKTVLLFMQAFSQIEQVLIDLNRKNLGDEPLTENSVIGAIILIDMDQFAVRQLRSIEGIQAITEICQNLVKYFPYVSSMFMFINCNIVTSALFKIVRPILESPSLKFEVYGQNKSEWQGRVSNFAPENLLRTPFGGTKPKENIIKRRKMVDRSQILSMNTIK
ncbi:unnamed protein product [Allacma fusca]|uniref:CRAL-TRIO domain-containing protein n=1 Tax=Allacma fusca TaxID=39272 RepID=A0A8J2JNJ7_9HEXA|nr:unnamed protein product [Allacma fusca]